MVVIVIIILNTCADLKLFQNLKIQSSDKCGLPSDVSALRVSAESEKMNSSAKSEGAISSKTRGIKSASSSAWPGADAGGTASLSTGTELSRSSSVSSLSSEKSTLNPHAKVRLLLV